MPTKFSFAFTLVETLLYLGLTVIFLSGSLGCIYDLILVSGQNQRKVLVQEEGNFLVGKFMWALAGMKNFSVQNNPASLTINKFDLLYPLIFDFSNGHLRLAEEGNAPVNLNADNVEVVSLVFRDLTATINKAEGLEVSFTVQSANGRSKIISQNFDFEEYLKQ